MDPRTDERQHLPLRRLHEHRRGDRARDRALMSRSMYARRGTKRERCASRGDPEAKFVAGGTNLIDLMRLGVERPRARRHSGGCPRPDRRDGGGRPADRRERAQQRPRRPSPRQQRYPALASAFLAGASRQLRNMATTGGNLLQRTRCAYFQDVASPATSASRAAAVGRSRARAHAILARATPASRRIPSDMCVALAAAWRRRFMLAARLATA